MRAIRLSSSAVGLSRGAVALEQGVAGEGLDAEDADAVLLDGIEQAVLRA